ncbi:hypothetical protein ElyMa_005154100 [Elysia marginata]|uniref:Uncharacterized protein n=1 Tax=Elysia marginata TaxID=1093978 RepID=A0AAV4JNB9_9GAST|nr:hypothetical protein ElyMa_005154100 [Elysia marginata]
MDIEGICFFPLDYHKIEQLCAHCPHPQLFQNQISSLERIVVKSSQAYHCALVSGKTRSTNNDRGRLLWQTAKVKGQDSGQWVVAVLPTTDFNFKTCLLPRVLAELILDRTQK